MKPITQISEFSSALEDVTDELPAPATVARSRWADLYELTKPRLNFLVLATTAVGFYMAVQTRADWLRIFPTLLGSALCAAGASILNQVAERRYDALMRRTSARPLPAGRIGPVEALVFGILCGIAGALCLYYLVNPLTAALGAFTLLSYILIYTPMKRFSTLNTIIGAMPGALPPVMGWAAARGSLSLEALTLFTILFVWQIPHFLSIAILYKDDYRAGGFKMLPVDDPDLIITSRQIVLYASALIPVSIFPAILGMAGKGYAIAAILLGLAFLSFAIACAATRSRPDARRLFFSSIIYLPLLLAALMLNRL